MPPAAPPNGEHVPVVFNGGLPGPEGDVAASFGTTPTADQKQQAIDLFEFLKNVDVQPLELNADLLARTAIINIPRSSKVRLVYGGGFGASTIGTTGPLDGKFLFLHGEGGANVGPPTPMVFPRSIATLKDMKCMTHAQFTANIAANYAWPLLRATAVNTAQNTMQIAPVPAFLVMDGFKKDIDAADLYERVLSIETDGVEMYSHLKQFLLSCLQAHNQADTKPHIDHTDMLAPVPIEGRQWAKDRFTALFPGLHPPVVPPVPHVGDGINPALQALLARLIPIAPAAPQQGEEKTEDDLIMLEETLKMCSKPENSPQNVLPSWFIQCKEKGMTESYKSTIVRKHIMANIKYDDADVPLTALLLKMIIKGAWAGKDGNIRRPSIVSALEGLSPFIVLELDEDEVADINEANDDLDKATHVTLQDIKNLKKKLKVQVPSSADDFILLLKRYGNLLFALFSEDCPLYRCIDKILAALKEFSRNARDALTLKVKASILWIVLLQSRQFAVGEMDILREFSSMHEDLCAKKAENISHSEVPWDLYITPTNKRKPSLDMDTNNPSKSTPNPNTWYPKLRSALQKPLEVAGYTYPSFSAVMKYCQKSLDSVYTKEDEICTPNAFFGRCYLGNKCKRSHSLPSDVKVEQILKMTEKFITSPQGLTRG